MAKYFIIFVAMAGMLSVWSVRMAKETTLGKLKAGFKMPDFVPFPESNPYSKEKETLGKELFFDPILSKNNNVSCASCHRPEFGFSDYKALSQGTHGALAARRTPTALNMAWGWSFFWDGRVRTLEEQVVGPIQNPVEMDMPLQLVEKRLSATPQYRKLFSLAFSNRKVDATNVSYALATYVRTLVSPPTDFDSWIDGDESAISDDAKRGFAVFTGKARCVTCHGGWNFTNGSFADTGVTDSDLGRGGLPDSAEILRFAFKTPTLRNIAKRAPYMHDGSFKTLEEVIEHYRLGGKIARENVRYFISPFSLTKEERDELVAFLQTLNSSDPVFATSR